MVPVLIASGLVLTGCTKITGGGWIPSMVPGEKATFGFTAKCANTTVAGVPTAVLHEGQFEFHDQGVGVDVHGDVEPMAGQVFPGMTCKQLAATPNLLKTGGFTGTYRTQSDSVLVPSHEGELAVLVFDTGKPATIDPVTGLVLSDNICVSLFGLTAPFSYDRCGDVEGGNVRVE